MTRGKASKVGDTRISPNGYSYTRTKGGWELTGRLVAAKTLGRSLKSNERIRYVDGNRINFDPNNIEVYVTTVKSKASRRAKLEAKIADLQAQLDDLDYE